MIEPENYHLVYIIVLSLLLLMVGRRYSTYPPLRVYSQGIENPLPSLILMVALILFLGLRPVHFKFGDTVAYDELWDVSQASEFYLSQRKTNFLFDNLYLFFASTGMDIKFFFLTIEVIYLFGIWIACRKMFPNDTLFTFLVYLTAFSTFNYGVNGIKAGAAASLFLVALAYKDKPKVSIPLIIASLGFHHSMILVICSYIAVNIVKNPKYYFAFWLFCCFMSIAHITAFQSIFARVADEGGVVYLYDWGVSRFRGDFVLYSSVPVLVGYIAVFKKGIKSKFYYTILNLYLMTNGVWMLCMYAIFTNRIAYMSWFLYPFVLIYPFLKEKWSEEQYYIGKLIAYAQFTFSIIRVAVFGDL